MKNYQITIHSDDTIKQANGNFVHWEITTLPHTSQDNWTEKDYKEALLAINLTRGDIQQRLHDFKKHIDQEVSEEINGLIE